MEALLPSGRILCIEDHEDTREVISLLLTREGYEVTCAESPREALTLLQSQHFDLFIVDTWLPGMSGLELCNKLRELDGEAPILFFTAAASEADRARAFESGAQGYLVKPVDTHRLAAKVTRLLSESKKRLTTQQPTDGQVTPVGKD
jgi:two-component system OmpR family response regulator